ncbi:MULTISPECIES: MraY family glycosyltransferase [unclassified Janthinobacterium]|uniref:MraY family glycosyltransferase n=1 Tax=unclassified Janthinobacterium TaxID=2610881 RepID=UPI000347CF2E|nr:MULTISPECIES: glycosyltransferase [unclassified Janthinobacterium]MEC5162226.1 UDP-N-acetylmuramyl pentapeptide phosphotransferase/UDP-N-acetylglucosamine-1-phosphate transferase [Janthinobacterium sp. CG_S6]
MMNEFYMLGIAAVAGAGSCAMCLLIICSQRWHGKHSLDHDLAGAQKFHVTAVPRIGGIAVFAGVALAVVTCMALLPAVFPTQYVNQAMKLLLASLPAFCAGIVEDLTKHVSVKVRLTATVVSALMGAWLLGAVITSLDLWGVDNLLLFVPAALLLTALAVAGGANAINIIDGFNGLAGSVVVIMMVALGFLAWRVGDGLVLTLALLGGGAACGFLVLNFPTGRLFLGDGGAYFLGFWTAELAVLLLVRNPSVNAWQVSSLCAYPVIEVLFSMYRRKIIRKSSPGAPDGLHLHTLLYRRVAPRLVRRHGKAGWVRNAAVTCLVAPAIAALAGLTLLVGNSFAGAGAMVCLQVALYLIVYKRLVRGRWWQAPASYRAVAGETKVKLS